MAVREHGQMKARKKKNSAPFKTTTIFAEEEEEEETKKGVRERERGREGAADSYFFFFFLSFKHSLALGKRELMDVVGAIQQHTTTLILRLNLGHVRSTSLRSDAGTLALHQHRKRARLWALSRYYQSEAYETARYLFFRGFFRHTLPPDMCVCVCAGVGCSHLPSFILLLLLLPSACSKSGPK